MAGDDTTTTPARFHTKFAAIAGLSLLLVVCAFTYLSGALQLKVVIDATTLKQDPRAALAGQIVGPILVLSVGLIALGVWMALVEWRAAFQATAGAPQPSSLGVNPAELIASLSKLKGAALVLISGVVLVVVVGWMVGAPVEAGGTSAGSTAPASATPAPSPTNS